MAIGPFRQSVVSDTGGSQMPHTPPQDDVEQRLIEWAGGREDVRAMLLTSTRAIPHAELDAFSDYDAVLVVRDVHPYDADRRWIADFGEVLVAYWDPIERDADSGLELFGNVVWYVDRPRIDFTLWPFEFLERIVAAPALPDELDAGYRVLLDKDGLAARLRPPTFAAFIPTPPDEATYLTAVNDFFEVAPVVAVGLRRDDLLYARWVLDCDMKHGYLLPMLQWRVESDRGWAMPARALGKGLRKELPAEIWDELHATYVGGDGEASWTALLRTMALYRRVAREVGDRLGYAYPEELDARHGLRAEPAGCGIRAGHPHIAGRQRTVGNRSIAWARFVSVHPRPPGLFPRPKWAAHSLTYA
jgi:aminoglycoside 6-adenylyltransferase